MPHELYLRAAAPHKQNAPLKLHAAVTGKFQVERTLESEAATEARVRASATAAEQARSERKVVMLDAPLPDARATKKGKQNQGASAFIKPSKVSAQAKPTLPSKLAAPSVRATPSGSGRASPMPPPNGRLSPMPPRATQSPLTAPALSSEERASLRGRMVRYLAIQEPRTEEEILKAMGSHRKHVLDTLSEVSLYNYFVLSY